MPQPTDEELRTISERLADALGPDVRVACAPLADDDPTDDLLPEEASAMTRAVPKRVREFAAGRRLARRLLDELGFKPGPVPARSDRSPGWPAGAIGAITHTRGLCIVAAARGGPNEGIGVDVEPNDPLQEDLHSIVCTGQEARWLSTRSEQERGRLGKVIFSAKESLYKCQHPISGTFLGFQQAEVDLDLSTGRFDAHILHAVAARFGDHPLSGVFFDVGPWLVTAMRWPPGP